MILTVEHNLLEKNCPSATLSTKTLTWTDLGLNARNIPSCNVTIRIMGEMV
jgi:hypothetical protein